MLAIEPMVAVGRGDIVQLRDESYGTMDNSLGRHNSRHTVAITEKGPQILTKFNNPPAKAWYYIHTWHSHIYRVIIPAYNEAERLPKTFARRRQSVWAT